jgi:UDP-N-acetyl-2-amino-2-deoxyglucuronate dehydrogenase
VLRIGLVGTGLIGWAHALSLQALIRSQTIDAELAVAYDVEQSRAEQLAAVTGAAAATTLDGLVERSDAVWVCTPTAFHREAADAAIAQGRALFLEKPMATDLAGAEAIAQAVDVPAQVGLVMRSWPTFRMLREVIASGELGAPMAAVFRDDQYFPTQGLYPSSWRADATLAGGGCLIEHSIHDVDILRFCLGEPVDISARTANHAGHEGVEDVAAVSMRFESGATADLVSVWHDILSRGSSRRVEVFCRNGLVWLDNDARGPLHVQTSDGTEVRPTPYPDWINDLPLGDDEVGLAIRSYVEADRGFVDAVTSGRPPTPGLGEGVIAHRLVHAAYRSAAAGAAPVVTGSGA